jgi:zinc transport system substrate-binding protein
MLKYGMAFTTILLTSCTAFAEVKVATSIKPIHSLVSTVMQGVGVPTLLVDGSNSPHTYTMKPSDAATLQDAQVIFWVGYELEAFLEKPLEALGTKAKVVSLIGAKKITALPVREGENFAADEVHEEEGHDHNHEGSDAHIWLDPENAKVILAEVATTLSEADPANAAVFKANAEAAATNLDKLSTDLKASLAPVRGQGFLVTHDAYQYFEKRFDVSASGAISINPENAPGAATLKKLKKRVADGQIKCIFSEPQFDTKIVNLLLEGSSVKTAVLDPLGANLESGPGLYENLLRDISKSLTGCLAVS